jgi:Phosphotransferase enzyme family
VLRSESQEDPSAHINLLQRYVTVVPLLAENVAFEQPAILHMDLHLANIFIESEKQPVITAIIDWQGAAVLPLSLTARFPRIVDYDIGEDPVTVDMPPELENEDPAAKEDREAVMVKKYWLAKTWNENPKLAAALQEPVRKLLLSLWTESGRTWTGELASFRHDLIEFVDTYEHCPVSFSQEERARHKEELEEYNYKIKFLNHFREVLGVSSEGWVSLDRYDAVTEANQELKQTFAVKQSNGDEELRQAWERLWPFSDK